MPTIPDPLLALVTYLSQDPGVYALTQGRVFGSELPADESKSMPRAAVVIQDAGGFGLQGSYSKLYHNRVDVRCYGTVASECKQVLLACDLALNDIKKLVEGPALIYSATKSSGPNYGKDQLTYWPFYFSVWSILTTYSEVN